MSTVGYSGVTLTTYPPSALESVQGMKIEEAKPILERLRISKLLDDCDYKNNFELN